MSRADLAFRGVVASDWPCVNCDYNLVGLRVEQVCPECGERVESSLRVGNLRQSRTQADFALRTLSMLRWLGLFKVALTVGTVLLWLAIRTISPLLGLTLMLELLAILSLMASMTLLELAPQRDLWHSRLAQAVGLAFFCSLGVGYWSLYMLGSGRLTDVQIMVLAAFLVVVPMLHAFVGSQALILLLPRLTETTLNSRIQRWGRWQPLVLGVSALAGLGLLLLARSMSPSGMTSWLTLVLAAILCTRLVCTCINGVYLSIYRNRLLLEYEASKSYT